MEATEDSAVQLRLLELERRLSLLEVEMGRATYFSASTEESVDNILKLLGRRVVDGRPNLTYFNQRFRLFEAALMDIRVLGSALGQFEAELALGRQAPTNAPDVKLNSKTCTKSDMDSDWALYWCDELKQQRTYHRKIWEFAYIAQALSSFGKIVTGNHGLGFGCGCEPLPSAFAKYGVKILATDLHIGDERSPLPAEASQGVHSAKHVRNYSVCPDKTLLDNISFEPVDMNSIPDYLSGKFDFCWSSSALEHLGDTEAGFRFIENAMKTLKPGGVAVHTFEFTVDTEPGHREWPTVIYNKELVMTLVSRLENLGYSVDTVEFSEGGHYLDLYADLQTKDLYARSLEAPLHLKTVYDGFVCTSFGLIVELPVGGPKRPAVHDALGVS